MSTFRYGNPAFVCEGARMRAYCRQLATVVAVNGDVDAANIDRVSQYCRRFILAEKPFILDLSGVNSFATQGISLLDAVDEDCLATGVEWSLIASDAVLQAVDGPASFPTANSVAEALHHFAEGIALRRRLLPILHRTA
jgi:anti-anti-sigma regulatory factor